MNTTIVGTDTLLLMAHNLLLQGDLTIEQYNLMVERNSQISNVLRSDVVVMK